MVNYKMNDNLPGNASESITPSNMSVKSTSNNVTPLINKNKDSRISFMMYSKK